MKRKHSTLKPVLEIRFKRPESGDKNCPECGEQLEAIKHWMTATNGFDWLWYGWACHECCVNYEMDLTLIPND